MLTLDEQIARLADHAEEVATAAAAADPDGVTHGAIELRGTVSDLDAHRRRRRWMLAVAAAVVLVGAMGVTLAPRWIEPDEPVATVPEVTEPPTFPESTASRPSRFPVLPADDPREQSVGGNYSGLSFGEPGASGQSCRSA